MTTSGIKMRNRIAALSCLLVSVSAVSFAIQGSSMVQLDDNSDWWSITKSNDQQADLDKFQSREIADTNFNILGVDITKGALSQADTQLGDASIVSRSNASAGRGQKCYVSKDKVFLIFEEGEVNSVFYLFSDFTPWNGVKLCARSATLSRAAATASGLQLGLTEQDVIKILGEPTVRRSNEFQYMLRFKKPTPPEKLDQLRNDNSGLSEKEFQDKFGSYEITVFIRVKFSHSKMEYLAISESEKK
jgi:hypothetical protein